jgi:glycosyltransferase involved in cell wall biosynthesis
VKVLIVAPGYEPDLGGVETHVTQLARRLADECEVEVVAQRTGTGRPALAQRDGVTVRRFAVPVASTNFAVSPGLVRYVSRHAGEADVVHGHSYHALPALAAARAAPGGRFVLTPHYHGVGHSPFRSALHHAYRPAGRRMFGRAAAVICVSSVEADLVTRDFPAAGPRIAVIPNGVEIGALRMAEPLALREKVVFTAGRLEPYKRVDRLIGAAAHLGDGWAVRVAGDGPARPALERAAAPLGSRAEFLGRVETAELRRWYRTAQVYVSLSEHEAFGITIVEALAAGARVVASDIPAHRELAARHAGITLVGPDEGTQEIAAAIVEAAGQPRPGAAGITTWDEVAAETLSLYWSTAR